MSAKEAILERLKGSNPLAVHEFKIIGYNENNIATRLSELQKAEKVSSKFRKGTHYKEWFLKEKNTISSEQLKVNLGEPVQVAKIANCNILPQRPTTPAQAKFDEIGQGMMI